MYAAFVLVQTVPTATSVRLPLVNIVGFQAEHIALDLDSGKIYWTVPESGRIMRADLDGTHVEPDFMTGLPNVAGIAIKPPGISLPLTSP